MAANCGTCGVPCAVSSEAVKCAGVCNRYFHISCVSEEVKTRGAKKDFLCDTCKKDKSKSSSSLGSSKSTPGTTLTKEFLINMMEAFKTEMFNELKAHNKEFCEFKTSLSFFSEKMDDTAKQLQEVNKQYKEIKSEYDALKRENDTIKQEMKELKIRVRNMEQYSRRSNIEIAGVPQTAKEDVISVITDVGKAIGITLRPEEVVATHRVPSFRPERTPPLIVQFTSKMVRDEWITKARGRKDLTADLVHRDFPKRRLFIGEHLTPETKMLLSRTKDRCKAIDWRYVWCREGKVFARKADGEKCSRIDSLDDLAKLG